MSVRLFQPMVAPHIQQVARALHEAGQLERYVTTICDRPEARTQRVLAAAGRIAGLDLRREFSRRRVTEIPPALVESHPWGELFRVAFARATRRDLRWHDALWDRLEHRFDRGVARSLHTGLTGVYGFLYSSHATFRRARALGLRIAYDLPSLEVEYVEGLLREEMSNYPELDTPFRRWVSARIPERSARRRAEFSLADVVIANSRLTRDSYAAAGLDARKITVLPLAAPPCVEREAALSGGSRPDAPLTLFWAGGFTPLKGAAYVVEAWRRARLGDHARLVVYGNIGLPDLVLEPRPEGIDFRGNVPREELLAALPQADALLFPSLADGFGMVATEAWSRGVPVLTTPRAGAADLVRPADNGLVFQAGSAEAIIETVNWCLANRAQLRAMREAALATAARWQWSDYRRELAAILERAGLFSRK